jgi:hypothetical protein
MELRLAETPMTYRIAEDAWRSLKGLISTMSYVRPPEAKTRRSQLAWGLEDQGRRFVAALANFLSAARMYVDSTADVISEHHGKACVQYTELKRDLSDRFDNSPGYRFCYRLRNLLQHTGSLPLTVSVRLDTDGHAIVELLANRDELLTHDWHTLVRADIENWPEDAVDVLPLFEAAWEAHGWIELRRARRAFEDACAELEFVRQKVESLGLKDDETPALIRIGSRGSGTWGMTAAPLPTADQVDAILRARDAGDVLAYFDSQHSDVAVTDGDQRTLAPGMCDAYELALSVLDRWHAYGPEPAKEQIGAIVASGPETVFLTLMGLLELAAIPMLQVETMLGTGVGEALAGFHRDVERSRAVQQPSASDAPGQLPDPE